MQDRVAASSRCRVELDESFIRTYHSYVRAVAKVVLAAITVLLLGSAGGGFLLLPALAPLHVWAGRRSGPGGRVGWSVAPGMGVGMTAWALLYRAAGEVQPLIWLAPCLCGLAAALAFHAAIRDWPHPARHAG